MPAGIAAMLLGCVTVYAALFGTGAWIYGRTVQALLLTVLGLAAGLTLARIWRRLAGD